MRIKILSVVMLVMNCCFAQQLPNMDFENWSYDPLSKSYSILDGPWSTSNGCTVTYPIPDPTPGPDTNCVIFATRSTDVKSGKYSLKLQNPPTIDESLGGLSSFSSIDGSPLVPFTFMPITFKGYYKYFKGNANDYANITVNLYDDNVSTILYGEQEVLKAANGWTSFSVALYKIPPTSDPKTVEVVINHALSGDGLGKVSPNTYLIIDNLSFGYSTSAVFDEAIKAGMQYHDGVLDITNLQGAKNLVIHNTQGTACGNGKYQFDTKILNDGIYVISFEQNGAVKNFKLPIMN